MPDPASPPAAVAVAAGDTPPAQTTEERIAALDERLNDSMGSFDAKLRLEQQNIATERDARQASVRTIPVSDDTRAGGNSNAASTRPDDDVSADDAGGADAAGRKGTLKRDEGRSAHPGDLKSERATQSGPAGQGDLPSGRTGAGVNVAGNGAVANEVPDGNDDDVVARRLRKAAEQETDPELRDKLWKEYVEYKNNTQGR